VTGIALEKREGAGKAGCWPHPWSACKQKAGGVTTGTSRTTGLPCAMVLTVSFVLFPGTGLSCPRHPQSALGALWEFSASVGAPEPHDFSVRDLDDRLSLRPRPSHPTANVRDDRETPLLPRPRDGRKGARDLPDAASASACGMLARRANGAWCACEDCPSGGMGDAR
jgi:hypothetical protein